MPGPLAGIKIIELAGLGPGPFCGMMLADHGAEVVRIERPGTKPNARDPLARSRRTVALDLKSPDGVAAVQDLARSADGLIEGFRPGVMERLGLGPDILLGRNPALVYGRMTGWGQTGPLAPAAGHDINYIALSGVLHGIGPRDGKPLPPLNYVGDFGGGAMMLAFGMLAALLAVKNGGPGTVVDCAMTDGSALLSAMTWGFKAQGLWRDERGANLLDGGTPFYDTYECACGGHMAVGSLEPQFFALLKEKLGLTNHPAFARQIDPATWPQMRAVLTEIFRAKTRDEWATVFDGSDACVAPVLSLPEAATHRHNQARQSFVLTDHGTQPAPAPRYRDYDMSAPTPADTIQDLPRWPDRG